MDEQEKDEQEKTEYEELKGKCLKKDGEPRANASEGDLARLTELADLLDEEETLEDAVDGDGLDDDDEKEPESDELLKARVAANRARYGKNRRNDAPLTDADKGRQRLLRCRLATNSTKYPARQRDKFIAELDKLDRRETLHAEEQ